MQWRRRHQHQWVIGSAQRSLLIRQSCLSSAGEGGASEEDQSQHHSQGHYKPAPQPQKTQQNELPDVRQSSSWKADVRSGQERSRTIHSRPTEHPDEGYILPPEAQFPRYPCGHPIAPYPRFYYPSMPASRYRPLQPLDWFNPRIPANCQVYYTLSHPRYDGLRAVPATAVQNAYWWPFNPGVYTPCNLPTPVPEQATTTEVTEAPPLIPPVTPYIYPGYAYGPAVLTPSPGHVSCRSQPPSENPPQIERTPKRKRKRKRKAKAVADDGREEEDDEASGSCCTSVTGDETTTSSVEDLNQSIRSSANGVRGDMEPLTPGACGGVASLSALARQIVERAVKEAQDDVCRSDVTSSRDNIFTPADISAGVGEGDGAEVSASASVLDTERLVNDQPMPQQERPSRDFPPLPLVNNVFAATLVDDIVSGALGVVRYLEAHDAAAAVKEVSVEVPAEVQTELDLDIQEEEAVVPTEVVPIEQPMGHSVAEPSNGITQDTRDILSGEDRVFPSHLNEWSDRNGFLEEDGAGQNETELHTEIVFISETSFMDEEESRAAGCAPPLDEDNGDQPLDPEQDKILNPDAPAFIPGDSWTSTNSEVDVPVRWSDDEEDEASSQQERASISSVSDSLKATSLLMADNESLKNVVPKAENRVQGMSEKNETVAPANEARNDFSHLPTEESGILDMAEELEEELGATARTLENYNPVRYKDYYQICSSVDVPDSPLELSTVVTRQPTRPSGAPLPAPAASIPQHPPVPAPSFPLGNPGEIVVHEVEDGASECGSEDVDTVGHAYEALASDTAKRHLYVNQLSLAAELLHTQQKLPYDSEFKPLVSEVDDVSSEAPSSGSHTNREVYENYYGNRTLMEMQDMARGCREVSDSGVQSEESSDETDDTNKARRQQRASTQPSIARQPLSAMLKGKSDPLCLCCHVM